jgi:hypothetical protein
MSLRAASGADLVQIAEMLGRTDPRFMLTVYQVVQGTG